MIDIPVVARARARRAAVLLAAIAAGCAGQIGSGGGSGQGVEIALQPSAALLGVGQVQAFQALVTGTIDTAVIWTISEGASGGSIDSGGTYLAPASPGVYHVAATSRADPTRTEVAAVTVTAASADTIVFWVIPGMARAGRDEAPGAMRSAFLQAGRAEYEPFQIVIRAGSSDLTGVSAVASDLTDGKGNSIPARYLPLYKEAYVEVPAACASYDPGAGADVNRPLGAGWYADGLIPFLKPDGTPNSTQVPFTVAANRNQPIWVDLHVPSGTPPGTYTGTVTVTSAGGGRATVPVALTVWDFELPAKPSMHSFFGVADSTRTNPALAQVLVEHKLNGGSFPANLTPTGQTSMEIWQHLVGGYCNGTAPAQSLIDSQVAAFGNRPDLLLYYYEDEVGMKCGTTNAALNAQLRLYADRVHQARAKFLLTDPPFAALLGYVDIWVPKADRWKETDPDWVAARQRGDAFWWYTTAETYNDPVNAPLTRYAPRWFLDFAPVHYRIGSGFISQSMDLKGTLYWQVAVPRSGGNGSADPWSNPCWRSGWGQQYASEASLLYPGTTVGLPAGSYLPSMRLKWIRDGAEDFEYVEMLKRLGRGDFALAASRSVGASFRTWSKDPAAIDAARRQLGEELHRLRGGAP